MKILNTYLCTLRHFMQLPDRSNTCILPLHYHTTQTVPSLTLRLNKADSSYLNNMYLHTFKLKLWIQTIKLSSLFKTSILLKINCTNKRQLKLLYHIHLQIHGFSILSFTALRLLHSIKSILNLQILDLFLNQDN